MEIIQQQEILPCEGDEALAQVVQRSCECPIPGSVQVQIDLDFEHPGLVEDVSTHGRWIGTG